jgi:hypothetical protein
MCMTLYLQNYYLSKAFLSSVHTISFHSILEWAIIFTLGIAAPIFILIALFGVLRKRYPPMNPDLDIRHFSSGVISLDTKLGTIIALFVVLPTVYAARDLIGIDSRGVAALSMVVVASVGSVTELLSFQVHYKKIPWKQVGLTWVLVLGIILLVFSVTAT